VSTEAWVYDDGGRSEAGFRGVTGDCTCRAIAIATAQPYGEVYAALNVMAAATRKRRGKRSGGAARTGVSRAIIKRDLEDRGWHWTPPMQIGSGCQCHLRADELPGGRLIVSVSRHTVALIDGTIHDTYDPSRGGTRCVYGYFEMAS